MFKQQFFPGARILPALFAILLSACTDLSAVRDWATTSLEATEFNEIVTTYADTPKRLAFYDEAGAADWNQQADLRASQAEALTQQLSLVSDYMAALAALADDNVTDYTGDVESLTASLKRTGRVSEPTLGAAGNLVRLLLNAAARAWQKDEVGDLIARGNAPLQNILNGELRSIVAEDFRRDLEIEAQVLDRHFEDLLRIGGGSDAANAALNEWFVLRKAENASRMAAVESYLTVLGQIAEGHQKLYDNRDDLDAKQLAKDLFGLAKAIRANVKQILKA